MTDTVGLPAAELGREQVELLPERTTLSAIEIGRFESDPGGIAVNSPWSNMVRSEPHAEVNNAGGLTPFNNAVSNTNSSIVQW
jgi:hypothetical protein